ncbi:putative scavenger mRNA-decapping enzyme DcpS [Cladorrhinum sp. PSN332]|nr:putative scavenger mRNA-decapping enzyme DcpS [Cladorrhinum sp. PSN332]
MSDEIKSKAEALVPQFKLERVLNQDQAGRRVSLLGQIDSLPALLIIERAPFPSSPDTLASIPTTLLSLRNLGANDIYHWYLANSSSSPGPNSDHDLKINLIYPCTSKHIKKYSKQPVRYITETPEIYATHVKPYIQSQRDAGHLDWVFNILSGKSEASDVIYRTPYLSDPVEGFLLLPDLNWDRKTLEALHLLGLVERRDIWSLRDLKKKHLTWLKHMKHKFLEATTKVYPEIERDQLKLYVHYQPTYYHFHIHIVHVQLEAGATQATGKAVGLDMIIGQLETMGGDEETGMESATLGYTLGEASELWQTVFGPLKEAEKTAASQVV